MKKKKIVIVGGGELHDHETLDIESALSPYLKRQTPIYSLFLQLALMQKDT